MWMPRSELPLRVVNSEFFPTHIFLSLTSLFQPSLCISFSPSPSVSLPSTRMAAGGHQHPPGHWWGPAHQWACSTDRLSTLQSQSLTHAHLLTEPAFPPHSHGSCFQAAFIECLLEHGSLNCLDSPTFPLINKIKKYSSHMKQIHLEFPPPNKSNENIKEVAERHHKHVSSCLHRII